MRYMDSSCKLLLQTSAPDMNNGEADLPCILGLDEFNLVPPKIRVTLSCGLPWTTGKLGVFPARIMASR